MPMAQFNIIKEYDIIQPQSAWVRDVKFNVIFVSPELAKKFLARNKNNRPVSLSRVKEYAADIKRGAWAVNGETLIFDGEGNLLNGQHRLLAIVAAEVGAFMCVVTGVPADAFKTLDGGKPRSAGNILAMNNVANYNQAAAVCRLALAYSSGAPIRGAHAPNTRLEITEFHAANPYVDELLADCRAARSAINPTPFCAVMFLANRKRLYDGYIADFIDGLTTGANLAVGDPRLTLRNWVITEKVRARSSVLAHNVFSATARAWNAYARANELKIIRGIDPNPNKANTPIVGFQ